MSTAIENVNSELLAAMPGRFYLSVECENCGEDVYSLCLTNETRNGFAVVPVDIVGQSDFECDNCGAVTYIGDLDIEIDTDGCADDADEDEAVES